MNIIFAGTPDFAAESLKSLIQNQHTIIAVYTQPDRPAGRGKKIVKSAVKEVAEAAGIPVFQPEKLSNDNAKAQLRALKADLIIVAAYGLILPADVLTIPKYGCINIHASLLPRWRGAAPIQRAIQTGDEKTGITIMQMDVGLDTGVMLLKLETPILANDTGGTLHDRLSELGASAIERYLAEPEQYIEQARIQDDSLANYAHKLNKQEAEIDWNQSATNICRTIRAFNPWPVAFINLGEQRIRIFEAIVDDGNSTHTPGVVIEKSREGITIACREQAITIKTLQLPGGKLISAEAFFNGGKKLLETGTQLSLLSS